MYYNPEAVNWSPQVKESQRDYIWRFHKNFENYQPSELIEIPNDSGIKLYVKSECSRFGLPSFKILGASWGVFRLLVTKFGLPLRTTSFTDLKNYINRKKFSLTLVASTDGNHGRAVAFMARTLGLEAEIIIPKNILKSECDKIESEGARVTVINGDYDQAVKASEELCKTDITKYLLVQDFAFPGYTEIPDWIAEGYSTLLAEIPFYPDFVFVPCGAGCFAQGVTTYYRVQNTNTKVCLVEPESAGAVNMSLKLKKQSTFPYGSNTIMDGLNCPTISQTAFDTLLRGVSYSCLISDEECVKAMNFLNNFGVNAGPCGAAPLAGFWSVIERIKNLNEIKAGASVVLISTEASRDFLKV